MTGSSAGPGAAVIVVAAGSGTRLGSSTPKAFVDLVGMPILERALRGVAAGEFEIVVVVPVELVDRAREIADGIGLDGAQVIAGAGTRQESVAAGLAALSAGIETVLVHDAARPLVSAAQFALVADAVARFGSGVIPVLPVTDTVKRVDASGLVLSTPDRSELVAVQTPQGFPRRQLADAYAAATEHHTDDAALFAAAGHEVRVVPGEVDAFKITTAADLDRARSLVEPGLGGGSRTGIGTDVHAFDESVPLRLGALDWPGEPGLAGHSDGDAVLHAIADALLSAGGLGDLGGRFGVDDERYRDADSTVFVAESLRLLAEAGFRVANVAVQVIAAHPRIGPRRVELEQRLTELVGAPVSVSATTSDGLGVTGRGEGIAAIATALLAPA